MNKQEQQRGSQQENSGHPYDLEIVKVNKDQINKEQQEENNRYSRSAYSQMRNSQQEFQGELQHDKYWHQPSRSQHLWHQSSSTWQHSTNNFQFGKENRFENTDYKKIQQVYNSSIYSLPSTQNRKTCSQGFGRRQQFPIHHAKLAQDNPAPDQYQHKSFVKDNHLCKSFGISWNKYYHNYYPEYYKITMKKPQPEFMKHSVGPGRYEVREKIGGDKRKHSFGKRFQNKIQNDNPPCNMYTLKEQIVQNERFNKITLGKGNKIDFSKPINNYPGPGNYQIPSFTDKFNKNRYIYNKNRKNFTQFDKPHYEPESPMKDNQKWIP